MTPTYWRSLAQLEERPESRAFLEREFPGRSLGASRGGHPARDDHAPRRLAVARGARGVPAPRRRDCSLCHRSRGDRPWDPALLRDDDAVPPERLRPDRREPRRAADQGRGKPLAPLDPRGLELARPGVRARPLRSRPLAIGHAAGCAEVLERFRDGLGAAVRGSCRGWRCQPCGSLRVLLLPDPGAPGLRAPCPLPQGAVGDLRRRQRREPGRGTAARHGARPRSHAPARSSLGDSRPRRRPAPDRPGDDPSRARLRGRKACGGLRWRDEPPLRR